MANYLVEISHQAYVAAIRALDAEIRHISDPVKGDLSKLPSKDQEKILTYSKAAKELKSLYLGASKNDPKLPPYETLVRRL